MLAAKLALSEALLRAPLAPAPFVEANRRWLLWSKARLAALWPELEAALPDCQAQPWRWRRMTLEEELMAKTPWPVLIGESREIPPMKPIKAKWRAIRAAQAVIHRCAEFRRSLTRRGILEASGTTVLSTESRKDRSGIYVVPVDPRDSFLDYVRKSKRIRGLLDHPVSRASLRIAARSRRPRPVPCPQAVVSVVSGYGLQRPWSAVGASGGPIPIGITLGTREVHFTMDHRLWNGHEGARFDNLFMEHFLEGAA